MKDPKVKHKHLMPDFSYSEIGVTLNFYSSKKMQELANNGKILYPIAYVDDLNIFTDAGYELFKDHRDVDFIIVQGVRVYLYEGSK